MGTLKTQSNGPLYSNTVIGTLVVDGWAVTSGTARSGLTCLNNFASSTKGILGQIVHRFLVNH